MKKLLCIIIVISTLVLSSCAQIPKATRFDSKSIDNGYNNYLAGGKMAYLNNNLYISYIYDSYKTLGTYKFNNTGVSQVMSDVGKIGSYAVEAPIFYQFNDNLYVLAYGKGIFTYDEENDKLEECQYDDITTYFTNDLKVDWDGELTIKYKDNPEHIIEDAFQCYVENNKIYYLNSDGWLYLYDVEKSEEPKFLSYLTESYQNHFHVCGDKVYFDHDEYYNERYETGLYYYSVKDDEFSLVLEGEINCLNSYNDRLYIATDKGIFTLDGKITDRSAKSIYLLDEDWIYAVENEKGNVYRVSLDGKTVEMIDFLDW